MNAFYSLYVNTEHSLTGKTLFYRLKICTNIKWFQRLFKSNSVSMLGARESYICAQLTIGAQHFGSFVYTKGTNHRFASLFSNKFIHSKWKQLSFVLKMPRTSNAGSFLLVRPCAKISFYVCWQVATIKCVGFHAVLAFHKPERRKCIHSCIYPLSNAYIELD